jgi:hypothetical protein
VQPQFGNSELISKSPYSIEKFDIELSLPPLKPQVCVTSQISLQCQFRHLFDKKRKTDGGGWIRPELFNSKFNIICERKSLAVFF